MADPSISNVLAIRADVIARSRTLQEAQRIAPSAVAGAAPTSFSDTLNAMVAKVSTAQENEDIATESYERGETTNIATTAIMQARASIAFEATLQVRNKVLSAYKDIMNMPLG